MESGRWTIGPNALRIRVTAQARTHWTTIWLLCQNL